MINHVLVELWDQCVGKGVEEQTKEDDSWSRRQKEHLDQERAKGIA